jgi:energy-coupling factor transporter ATP-binding protein EcfA2
MPPLKRFRDMEHLSGGEKTMAALALLFAIHSFQPSPFFVLDEVDAALDNANVAKLVNYIKNNARPGMQFIVISLKPTFFEGSQTLVGVMRDQSANSSKTLTLDVSGSHSREPKTNSVIVATVPAMRWTVLIMYDTVVDGACPPSLVYDYSTNKCLKRLGFSPPVMTRRFTTELPLLH